MLTSAQHLGPNATEVPPSRFSVIVDILCLTGEQYSQFRLYIAILGVAAFYFFSEFFRTVLSILLSPLSRSFVDLAIGVVLLIILLKEVAKHMKQPRHCRQEQRQQQPQPHITIKSTQHTQQPQHVSRKEITAVHDHSVSIDLLTGDNNDPNAPSVNREI